MPPQGGPARKKRRQKVLGHVAAPSNPPPSYVNVAGSGRLLSCPPAQRGPQLSCPSCGMCIQQCVGSSSPTFESHLKLVRASVVYLENVTHKISTWRGLAAVCVVTTVGLDCGNAGSSNYLDLPVEANFVICGAHPCLNKSDFSGPCRTLSPMLLHILHCVTASQHLPHNDRHRR
jgi:hypothetical protein